MLTNNSSEWYALQVYSRQEIAISRSLLVKGLETYVPLSRSTKKLSDRVKKIDSALFPGYVFCRMTLETRLPVVTTPGVVRLVGIGQQPIPILQPEMDALKKLEETQLERQPSAIPSAGERVLICGGPLEGVEGLLVRANRQSRLLLTVSVLHRAVSVEVEEEWVTPLNTGAAVKQAGQR